MCQVQTNVCCWHRSRRTLSVGVWQLRTETVWKLNFCRCAREIADRVDRVYYVELALIEHRVRKKAPRGFSFQPTSSPSSSLQLQVC